MASEEKQTMDVMQLAAWVAANKKQLIAVAISIAVIGLCVGIYVWHGNHREAVANDALAAVKPVARMPGVTPTPPPPDAYLKVANEYPNTTAGARALLIAGTGLFDEGKFKEAESLFTRFMQDYPDYPLSDQAQLGIAASLEAEGKNNEAATHYKEFREHHPSDSAWPEASSALARLYDEQGKPDQALKIYQEMLTKRNNDTWTQEAPYQMHEILVKHPELAPKPTPPPTATTTPNLSIPLAQPKLQSVPGTSSISAPPRPTNGSTLLIPPPTGKSPGSSIPLTVTNKP